MKAKAPTHYGPFFTAELPGFFIVGIYWRGKYHSIKAFRSKLKTKTVFDPLSTKHRMAADKDLFSRNEYF